jgi:NIMA (never in mitosis gene a)-related kinase
LFRYRLASYAGEGAYSSVYKVRRFRDDREYALKKVKIGNLSEKEKENALNEVRILASINHPNIIGYKEAFLDEPSNSLWYFPLLCSIVMEYADDGDLYQKITDYQKRGVQFEENWIWNVLTQVVRGLKTLHKANILHRDLKVTLVADSER